MTISTNCAYNNQTHCNIKNLYFNKHKHKHMVNHICWNPSFFPLPNADIHEISNFYQKRHLFIKNYSFFIKNLIDPPYKKLQPQISPFIKKNSTFGNERDPCHLTKNAFQSTIGKHPFATVVCSASLYQTILLYSQICEYPKSKGFCHID